MSINQIAQGLTYFLAMLLGLTFHEAAHAFVSHVLGDDTAKREGRLSLNPAVHMDMIGTVALPLVCSMFGAPFIGWAKPSPVDERNFKNPKMGAVVVASAGPFSNLVLAAFSMVFVGLVSHFQWPIFASGSFLAPVVKLASAMVYVNGILAFLNLIPLPPLDGAQLLRIVLSPEQWDRYESVVAPYGFFIFMLLAFSGGLNWVSSFALIYARALERIVVAGLNFL